MVEKEKTVSKEMAPAEYGVVLALVVAFGIGLMFKSVVAGAFLGGPIGFIAGILYGNMVKNKK